MDMGRSGSKTKYGAGRKAQNMRWNLFSNHCVPPSDLRSAMLSVAQTASKNTAKLSFCLLLRHALTAATCALTFQPPSTAALLSLRCAFVVRRGVKKHLKPATTVRGINTQAICDTITPETKTLFRKMNKYSDAVRVPGVPGATLRTKTPA